MRRDCCVCFNSRAHARRDTRLTGFSDRFLVSIHAPTRGATCDDGLVRRQSNVSIHAPTRGATAISASPCSTRLSARFSAYLPFLAFVLRVFCTGSRSCGCMMFMVLLDQCQQVTQIYTKGRETLPCSRKAQKGIWEKKCWQPVPVTLRRFQDENLAN